MFTGNYVCASFKAELFRGVHDFSEGGHTFRLALYDETATLGPTTTAYTATGEVAAGGGYTAGGFALTQTAPQVLGATACVSFANVSVSDSAISARGGLIYNSSVAGNPAVLVLDFGLVRTSVSGIFRVVFPPVTAEGALLRIG